MAYRHQDFNEQENEMINIGNELSQGDTKEENETLLLLQKRREKDAELRSTWSQKSHPKNFEEKKRSPYSDDINLL